MPLTDLTPGTIRSRMIARATGACTSAEHEASKADERTWQAHALLGYQSGVGGARAELRRCCRCGSTLARRLFVADPDEPEHPAPLDDD